MPESLFNKITGLSPTTWLKEETLSPDEYCEILKHLF